MSDAAWNWVIDMRHGIGVTLNGQRLMLGLQGEGSGDG